MLTKILCVTPHLSTGGCPQYLLYKLQHIINEFDIMVVEYSNVSDEYIVQKSKIISLLKENRFYTLGENKFDLLKIINDFNPDIVHLEELNEYFIDTVLASKLFDKNRKYLIYETSHDAGFNINSKRFFPDRFVFVSKYQYNKFKTLNIPTELIEYPIIRQSKNRNVALNLLGLDKNKFHVINIGLFTPRKNQGELIEIAKKFESEDKIQFHFIGNTAPNFENYWKPLITNLPTNCKIWGERNDVENFYNFADLFYFASKGNAVDKETNPLVVRESISYNLPILLKKIDSYEGMFDNIDQVFFIDDDIDQNYQIVKFFYNQWLKQNNINVNNYTVNNNNYFNRTENKIHFTWTKASQNNIRVVVRDVISKLVLYSYLTDIQENYNYWIVPIGNIKFGELNNFKGFQLEFYNAQNDEIIETINIIVNNNARSPDNFIFNVNNTDPTWYNYYEFFYLKKYKELDNISYDITVDIGANCGAFTRFAQSKNAKQIFAVEPNNRAYKSLINTFQNSNVICLNYGLGEKDSQEILYSCDQNSTLCSLLKEQIDKFNDAYKNGYQLEVINIKKFDTFLKENGLNNKKINVLKVDVEGYEYNIFQAITLEHLYNIDNIIIELHHIDKKTDEVTELLDKLKTVYNITYYENSGDTTNNIYNVKDGMGVIICTKKNNYQTSLKLKAVHLLSLPETEREQKSINSIQQLTSYGIKYVQNINEPYIQLPPKDNCSRPDAISNEPGDRLLSPGHYGCYLAHTQAILNEWEEGLDGLLIFECDGVIVKPHKNFINIVEQIFQECEKYKIRMFSFGPAYINEHAKDMGLYNITPLMYEMHAYLITKSNIQFVQEQIKKTPWDVFDMWVTDYFQNEKLAVLKEPYAMQAQGFSLLDKKNSTHNWLGQQKV